MSKKNNGNEGFEIFGLVVLAGMVFAASSDKVSAFLEKVSVIAVKVLNVSLYVLAAVLVLFIGIMITKAVLKAKKRKKTLRIQELENLKNHRKDIMESSVAEAFHFGVAEEIAGLHSLDAPLLDGYAKFSETNHVYHGNLITTKIHKMEQEIYGNLETRAFTVDLIFAITRQANQARMNSDILNTRNSYRKTPALKSKSYDRY